MLVLVAFDLDFSKRKITEYKYRALTDAEHPRTSWISHREALVRGYSTPHFSKPTAANFKKLVVFNEISFKTTRMPLCHCPRFEDWPLLPLNWRGMCSSLSRLLNAGSWRFVKGELRVVTEVNEDPQTNRSDFDNSECELG
jgi:hypothetical protein